MCSQSWPVGGGPLTTTQNRGGSALPEDAVAVCVGAGFEAPTPRSLGNLLDRSSHVASNPILVPVKSCTQLKTGENYHFLELVFKSSCEQPRCHDAPAAV